MLASLHFCIPTGNNGIHFHHLKSILNDDLFKEYINPVIFINLKFVATDCL